jgi:hypothetical protein
MTIRVEALKGLDLRLGAGGWAFATVERKRIDAHWQSCAEANPRLWNGDVLICTGAEVTAGILSARFAMTDYASFIAWRDWGWPDPSVRNCFGVPAVTSADGALLFGIMGSHTLNSGRAYPPSGSLEARDVLADGSVDIRGSIRTELLEETGLDAGLARPGRMLAIFEGQRLAVVEQLSLPLDFAEIEAAFQRHTQGDPNPELMGIEAIRSSSQIDSRMPGYAQEIIRLFLG